VGASPQPTRGRAGADKPRPLWLSVGTGLGLAAVVLGTLFAGPPYFFALAAVIIIGAQAELYAVLKANGHVPAVLLGLVCGIGLLITSYLYGPVGLGVWVTVPLLASFAWGLTVSARRIRSIPARAASPAPGLSSQRSMRSACISMMPSGFFRSWETTAMTSSRAHTARSLLLI
jgi:CDP-diglyceride synthetase